MSTIKKLVKDIQEQNRRERQQAHQQTVTLDQDIHSKLVKLSENLQTSKTSLASKLLAAAVEEAYNETINDRTPVTPMRHPEN